MKPEQKKLVKEWLTTAREEPSKGGPTQWVFENFEMLQLLEIVEQQEAWIKQAKAELDGCACVPGVDAPHMETAGHSCCRIRKLLEQVGE